MDASAVFPLPTRRSTKQLAALVAEQVTGSDLVVVTGPVGAGKTFFTRALCRALGVPRSRRITSPTFSLVHEHTGRLRILHADLYRIDGERQLHDLGLEAQRDEGYLLVVEWGAPYIEALGGDAFLVDLALAPRRATLAGTGVRSNALASAIRASKTA